MAKTRTEEAKQDMALIEVPICGAQEIVGPILIHLDCRLKPNHRATLARIRTALAAQHATLVDGGHVESVSDCVRWILEQVEAEA